MSSDEKNTKTDHRLNIINNIGYTIIKGVLSFPDYDDWCVVRSCRGGICVKSEGCPCDKLDDTMIWLPKNCIPTKTNETIDGQEVLEFKIKNDTKIFVEQIYPTTVGELQNAKKLIQNNQEFNSISDYLNQIKTGEFLLSEDWKNIGIMHGKGADIIIFLIGLRKEIKDVIDWLTPPPPKEYGGKRFRTWDNEKNDWAD